MCPWTTCCCRCCQTASYSHAFGSKRRERKHCLGGTLKAKVSVSWHLMLTLKEILFEHSPFPHLQPGRGHSHWETRRRWWRSLPQNSGSISSSQISGRPHQTFWKYRRCGWWVTLNTMTFTQEDCGK